MTNLKNINNGFNNIILESSYFSTMDSYIGSQRKTVNIFKNPSLEEIKKHGLVVDDYWMRAILDMDGNIYVWKGYEEFHVNVARHLGIDQFIGVILYTDGSLDITDGTSKNLQETEIPYKMIIKNPWIKSKFPNEKREIRYFNDAIVGNWEEIDEQNQPKMEYANVLNLDNTQKQSSLKTWNNTVMISKSENILDIQQRRKSGLQYYNSSADESEIQECRRNIIDLYQKTSNNGVMMLCSLHPFGTAYTFRISSVISLYSNNIYLDESYIKDENDPNATNWIYEVYGDQLSNADINLRSLRDVVAYLILNNRFKPDDMSYFQDSPFWIYKKGIENGCYFDSDFINIFLTYVENPEEFKVKYTGWTMPEKDSDIYNLIYKSILKQRNFDNRILIRDPEKLEQEIDKIFQKSFINCRDFVFLKTIVLNAPLNVSQKIAFHLRKHFYKEEDPYNVMGKEMQNFPSTNDPPLYPSKCKIDNKELEDFIYDVSYPNGVDFNNLYDFKFKDGSSFKIKGIILEFLNDLFNNRGYYVTDVEIIPMEDIFINLNKINDKANREILDENLNPLSNDLNQLPDGMYIHITMRGKYGDEWKYYCIKTGDDRDILKNSLHEGLNYVVGRMNADVIGTEMNNFLDNIPKDENERKKYLHDQVYKNSIFLNGVKKYISYLETTSKDGYYLNDYHRKNINEIEKELTPIIKKVKNKLQLEEIMNIYENIDEEDDKVRFIAQSGLVDDKTAIDIFNHYTQGTWYLDAIYKMFDDSKGFSEATQNYFKQKHEEYKQMSALKGQDVFNNGLENGEIKIKHLSDYPQVKEVIGKNTKDFFLDFYSFRDEDSILSILEDIPIYIVNKMWLEEEMKKQEINRMFPDISINDARGVFTPHLNSINGGKPFVVIYNDETSNKLIEVQEAFGIDQDAFGDTISHEVMHALQYAHMSEIMKHNESRSIQSKYKEPWLEDPDEIVSIVYGNIPYIYKIILDGITKLFQSGDMTLVGTLVEYLASETRKVEYYQIDTIYDDVSKDNKQNFKETIGSSDYEMSVLKDSIRNSILSIDAQSLSPENIPEYATKISDDILQIVMSKWFDQFNIDYASNLYSSQLTDAEKIALKVRMNFEKARREEFQQSEEKPEYKTYGRESLQKLLKESPENEKEFFEKLKLNPEYIEIIQTLSEYFNNLFNPNLPQNQNDNEKRIQYRIWFFDNGDLKVPSSLEGLENYFNKILSINIEIYGLNDKINRILSEIKKYRQELEIYRDKIEYFESTKEDEKYPDDELYELVQLLTEMHSEYGPSWIWAKKEYTNLYKLSNFDKKRLFFEWAY